MNTLPRMSLATAAVLLTLSACAQSGLRGEAGREPGMMGQEMGHGSRTDEDNMAGWSMMTE